MAAARHFIADHLLNTELQLLRSVTAKDPVVRPQSAAAQIFRRAVSGEAHPDLRPGLHPVGLNGYHLPGQNQEALSGADGAVCVLELIFSAAF